MTGRLGGEFCLVCGADPPLFGDRMCEPCMRARTTLAKVPENVPWVRCARCGIVEIDGKWENTTDNEVWDELLHRNLVVHERAESIQLGMESKTVSDRHTLLYIQIEGVIDDLLFQEEHTMRARMANGVCLTCTRRAGNYFEATVQLRSSARRLSEEEFTRLRKTLDDVLEKLSDDPMFFITSEGPVTGGYDVVLGSKGLARAWGRHLISEYGGMVIETNSTVGRKDGVDVTRLTLLYRKPGYEIGDVITWRGHTWRPSSWTKDGAIMERVDRRERTGATWRDLEQAKVLAQLHELVQVDFVTEDASVGEFLDPSNWRMESVRLPNDHELGRKGLLVRNDDAWLSLPHFAIDLPQSSEES